MVKFLDLQAVNALHAEALKKAAARVIDNGWYLQGNENKILEDQSQCIQTVRNGHDIGRPG